MSQTPLISVVTPVYNAARYLPEAIASVREQRYEPLEIIVVDDGSTDSTPETVRSLGSDILYVRQENAGPAAARNRGLRLARGEFVGLLDADDQWPPDKLRIQLERFRAEPELEVVCGRIRYIQLEGGEKPNMRFEGPDQTVRHIHLGCGLFRRAVFEKVGLFDESLRFSEDHDWFLRARERDVKMVILKDVTLLYRLHSGNVTRGKDSQDFLLTRVLKKSLDRRRQAGKSGDLKRWSDYDEAGGA